MRGDINNNKMKRIKWRRQWTGVRIFLFEFSVIFLFEKILCFFFRETFFVFGGSKPKCLISLWQSCGFFSNQAPHDFLGPGVLPSGSCPI